MPYPPGDLRPQIDGLTQDQMLGLKQLQDEVELAGDLAPATGGSEPA